MIKKSSPLFVFVASVLLSACGDSPSSPENNATEFGHVYTYLPQTPVSGLRDPTDCVNYTEHCNIAELPFIAMSYPEPKITDVMSRVVVSHDWMGARFEAVLTQLPDEILTLLGSVTAIVIADNIRPSFYWTGSGAIYLDPANLWLTNAEKNTIDKEGDYRDDFASGLRYDFFHRFVKNNQAAYQQYSLTGDKERTMDDILVPMASLLFHELAHANDFMSVSLMPSLDPEQPTWSEINRFSGMSLNTRLKQYDPISDATLKGHASVLYSGRKATDEQKSDNPLDLGLLMQQEGANHLYAYSHQAEDVAMLFQASMLQYFYDIQMDSAFVIQPEQTNGACEDYLVAWGQRNRIADTTSKPRARFVSEQLLPDIDFNAFFNQLEDTQNFPALINWCNISLSESPQTDTTAKGQEKNTQQNIQKSHHHGVISSFQ